MAYHQKAQEFEQVRRNKKYLANILNKRRASRTACSRTVNDLNLILSHFNVPFTFELQNPTVEDGLAYYYFDAPRPGRPGETADQLAERLAQKERIQQQNQQKRQKALEAKIKAKKAKKARHLKERAAKKALMVKKTVFC